LTTARQAGLTRFEQLSIKVKTGRIGQKSVDQLRVNQLQFEQSTPTHLKEKFGFIDKSSNKL